MHKIVLKPTRDSINTKKSSKVVQNQGKRQTGGVV
jgi:hypothetical protein